MCLALLASVLVIVLRPGETAEPAVDNGGLVVFLASLLLVVVYPDALLPISIAFGGSMLIQWYRSRKITPRDWRWGLWVLVPALPLVAYDFLTLMSNPAVVEWVTQRGNAVPTIPFLLLGMGIPLLIGLPAIYRAVRQFEADGDRFMLLWLLAMLVLMYLPLQINQYFLVGLMLPLGYFATRGTVDFWFRYIKRRYRGAAYVVFVPLIILSHLFWLFVPVVPILQNWSNVSGNVLEADYAEAFHWLDTQTSSGTVILSAPTVGTWIPLWVGGKPVYGHPAETMDAETKSQAVRDWYQMEDDNCQQMLMRYGVQYVLYGPREMRIGSTSCIEELTFVATFGRVEIYATSLARMLR
jgi:hypothetical protein